ncbi:MAG TPA: type II toxin-antitoxin system prevent-host-death family antitoxin [Gemmataceae bacterium]|nr:type II toxin-antitoxin system prevent-host-death family antitoxin [Gemmataceae bacterium]
MTTVGSYEAKTHLSQLLDRVSRGETILITRHGQAVAMLVPPVIESKPGVRHVVGKMRELRKGVTLGPDLTIRQLIEEGRRF